MAAGSGNGTMGPGEPAILEEQPLGAAPEAVAPDFESTMVADHVATVVVWRPAGERGGGTVADAGTAGAGVSGAASGPHDAAGTRPDPKPTGTSQFGTGPLAFVRGLASELSGGEVRLPSFPDVVERVRRQLDTGEATHAQVARLLSADAALAARVLRIANSATFNPGGRPIAELSYAVARIGHDLVRCAAISFALQQLRAYGQDAQLRAQLHDAWKKGTLVAAIASVLARETHAAAPETALVAGLLHNVGRLYIVARAHAQSPGFEQSGLWDQVLHDWHPEIGRAILDYWRFPAPILEAVAAQNRWDRPCLTGSRLPEVLAAAVALVPCVWYRETLPDTVATVTAFGRLQLDAPACERLLVGSAAQIRQLRDALAG